ncbi:hypothetical protein [Deinococcus planocerae]|nr:hypothetical protein [Deinococcus planocerae]
MARPQPQRPKDKPAPPVQPVQATPRPTLPIMLGGAVDFGQR